jgi:hypothetical protein
LKRLSHSRQVAKTLWAVLNAVAVHDAGVGAGAHPGRLVRALSPAD